MNYINVESQASKIKLHASEMMQKGCTFQGCTGNAKSLWK